MGGELEISVMAEPPHSIGQAKVDEKGRLKLPAEFLDWFKKSNVVSLFVTTLDKRTARIYPILGWKSSLNLLENAGQASKAASDLAFVAKKYGGDVDIDSQGRVMLPSALRELLGMESAQVFLDCEAGRINVTTKAVHDARTQMAEANLDEKLEMLEKMGLK